MKLFAGLCAGLAAYHWDVIMGGRSYYLWDLYFRFFPSRALIGESLRQGILPLWNPFLFCGQNQAGNIQAALLYPGTWIFSVPSFPLALAAYTVVHQGLTLWGMYRLSRYLSVSPGGAVFASISWGFSGALAARIPFLCQFASLAWLPWIVLFSLRSAKRGAARDFAYLSAALCLCFLAGQPRSVAFALLASVIAFLVSIRQPRHRRGRS